MSPRLSLKAATGFAGLAALAVFASACAPTMTHHGYLAFDGQPSKEIKVGDSQAAVLDKFGAPSQTSVYDPQEWYYIDQTSMRMTYKQPHVTARSVTVVDFDPTTSNVAKIQVLSLADGRALTPNPNKTPTRGRSLTALEQVLGTVGHQRLDNAADSDPGHQRRKE